MTAAWLAFRYFGSWRRFFSLTTSLSVIGMAIGVASLVVSMAVFSGYVSTLEKTVQDAIGHVLVFKRGSADQQQMLSEIKPLIKGFVAATPFVYAEAILAHKGKINGVLIEGVEESSVGSVLNLKSRVVAGKLDLSHKEDEPVKIMVGKGIADRFELKVGDMVSIVIPLASEYQASAFRPKLGHFQVAGVINYGRYDFDSRYIVMPLADAQRFVELKDRITGYRVRIENPNDAHAITEAIAAKFGPDYWARDWVDVNKNLFEAARLEKAVLFFVLMILVVAAAFNIGNTLFISVVQRYRDISVLKTIGASDRMIRRIFSWQGLIVGAVGALMGIALGLTLCRLFEYAQVRWKLIPAEVYKLDHINLDVRPLDLVAIIGASLVVCFLATLVPARRGSKISPVEGLRYE